MWRGCRAKTTIEGKPDLDFKRRNHVSESLDRCARRGAGSRWRRLELFQLACQRRLLRLAAGLLQSALGMLPWRGLLRTATAVLPGRSVLLDGRTGRRSPAAV